MTRVERLAGQAGCWCASGTEPLLRQLEAATSRNPGLGDGIVGKVKEHLG